MDRYLLLCRVKNEDGTMESEYKWFHDAGQMKYYVETLNKIYIKVFVDYAGEIIKDRIIIQREFRRDIELGEKSKDSYPFTAAVLKS